MMVVRRWVLLLLVVVQMAEAHWVLAALTSGPLGSENWQRPLVVVQLVVQLVMVEDR
jgi:hypothetical protein